MKSGSSSGDRGGKHPYLIDECWLDGTIPEWWESALYPEHVKVYYRKMVADIAKGLEKKRKSDQILWKIRR